MSQPVTKLNAAGQRLEFLAAVVRLEVAIRGFCEGLKRKPNIWKERYSAALLFDGPVMLKLEILFIEKGNLLLRTFLPHYESITLLHRPNCAFDVGEHRSDERAFIRILGIVSEPIQRLNSIRPKNLG